MEPVVNSGIARRLSRFMTACIFLCLSHTYSSGQPTLIWAGGMGSTSTDQGLATTTDASGNNYYTGYFTGTTDFDPGPGVFNLTPTGSGDVFVAKFDPGGTLTWAVKMGGFGFEQGQGIAVDGSGNVYVTGYYLATGTFGGSSLSNAGSSDVFICKLSPAGAGLWGRRLGGSSGDRGQAIAVDGSGNVVVAGFFEGGVNGIATLTTFGLQDAFVLSLNTAGTLRWAKQLGGPSYDYAYGVAVDNGGNPVVTGYFDDTANFDPGFTNFSLTTVAGTYDVFVTKLAVADGAMTWAKSMGGDSGDFGQAVAVDGSNNVYTTGYFMFGTGNPVDFDPGTGTFNLAPTPGSGMFDTDIFVSKLDGSGNFVWAAKLGGTQRDEGLAIAVDGGQNVFITGDFLGTADFDPGAGTADLISGGNQDIFTAKLNSTGSYAWAFQTGASGSDYGFGIAVDPSGNVFTTGHFSETVDFAPGTCVLNFTALLSNPDIFVRKVAQSPPPPPLITGFNPISGPAGTVVTINGSNFDPTPANNILSFNGNPAVVTTSSATTITTTVPVGTLTGPIILTIGCASVQSADAFTATGSCNIPTVQRDALTDLYSFTNGALWTNNTNWLSADESTWHGVTVAGCRVTEIDLSFNNLAGTLPGSLANINTLQRLKLNSNTLFGTLPPNIGNLTALIEINVQSNGLGGAIPPSIIACSSLENLHLEGNSFGGLLPSFLGSMTSLRSINLGFNNFAGTIPPELGNLSNLTFLSLADNFLSGTIPVELGGLSNLQLLDLSRNDLAGALPPELGNLSNLISLQLWSNQLNGGIPPELGSLNSLQELDLSQNLLTGSVPSELGNLGMMWSLRLDNNQLDGTFPPVIAANVDLEIVHLNDNLFTSLPPFDDEFISELTVANNRLEFDDLELNITCTGFSYDPQATLPPGNVFTMLVGDPLNISISTPGSANQYQWFKDGVPLAGMTSPTLDIPAVTAPDGGIYYVEVTSTIVTGITLQSDPYLVRINPCTTTTSTGGSLDISFDPLIDTPTSVVAMGIQSDGSVIAATGVSTINGTPVDGIIKFNPDGSLDTGFGVNTIKSSPGELIIQPDNKILTTFTFGSGDSFKGLTRLNADGSDDVAFSTSISPEYVYGFGLQPDGKIIVSFNEEASPVYLLRILPDGTDDPSFAGPLDMPANVIRVQSDFRVLVGGNFSGHIMRLDPSGAIDPTFSASANGLITDILIQPDNKILVTGMFTYVNGIPKRGVVRLLPDGQLDNTFTAAGITDDLFPLYHFTRIGLQSDNKILLAGSFSSVNGRYIANLIRLLPGGTMDCSFSTGSGPNNRIEGMGLDAGGKVLISGNFTDYNGEIRNGLARVIAIGIAITLQPQDVVTCEGAMATFSTAATGTTNITYQWQYSLDGILPFTDIAEGGGYSNVTTPILTINTAGGFGEGRYRCRINGDLVSEVATNDEGLFTNPPPAPPTTTDNSICGSGTITLSASGSVNGNYRWYTVITGGSPIPGEVNDTYTTPVLTSTTAYYVSVKTGGCESATRTVVTATVDPGPGAPGGTGSLNCGPGSVTLTATGGAPGDYRWYTTPTGGIAIPGEANGQYVTPVLAATTTYYVSLTSGSCEGVSRTAVLATIATIPALPTVTGASSCGTASMSLTASGGLPGEYRWYTVPSGGTALSGEVNAVFVTPVLSTTTSYYVSLSNGSCESLTRASVSAVVNPIPSSPVASGASACLPTALMLVASGGSPGEYRWYTVATGGSALPGEVNDTYLTPLLTTTTTFHVAINNGLCEGLRTPVMATIDVVAKPGVITSNCTATGATLAGPSGFSGYSWSNGSTTQQINVSTAGTYTLVVTSSAGCVSPVSDPVVFTTAFCNQSPVLQPATATTTLQGKVTVNIASLITDLDNNIDLTSLKVTVQPSSGASAFFNTNFELIVDYSNVTFAGTDQLTIEVCDLSGACVQQVISVEVAGEITVYNALSPNGDGLNDIFYIQYINALPETQENRVTILNRWGNVVFEVDDYDNVNRVFRGVSSSGSDLPSGTYYYVLEFMSGAPKKTGFISLRR